MVIGNKLTSIITCRWFSW